MALVQRCDLVLCVESLVCFGGLVFLGWYDTRGDCHESFSAYLQVLNINRINWLVELIWVSCIRQASSKADDSENSKQEIGEHRSRTKLQRMLPFIETMDRHRHHNAPSHPLAPSFIPPPNSHLILLFRPWFPEPGRNQLASSTHRWCQWTRCGYDHGRSRDRGARRDY